MAIIAISAAAIVNIYLIFLVVDANSGYTMGITALSPALRAVSIFVISIILVLQFIRTRSLNLDFFIYILLLYLILGSIVGFINNGLSYEFVRHLFAAATMLIAYWAGRFLMFEGPQVDRALRWWAWISVAGGVLAWVMAYKMILTPAFSMSPVSQILPLSVGLTTGSTLMFALALLMIAFGNKRDVILGAAAIFAVAFIRRYLANVNAGLRIVAGAILTVIFALVIFLTVAQGTQLLAKLAVPLPANLAERSNRVMDFVGDELRRDGEITVNEGREKNQNTTSKNEELFPSEAKKVDEAKNPSEGNGHEVGGPFLSESLYWRLEKLTSARMSLAASVYNSVSDNNMGLLLGKGFGSSYTWRYWSDNLNEWQTIVLYQCDLMPLWFLLTSGSILSILLVGGIFWKLFQIFIYSTSKKIEIAALLVIGSSFGMLLSFQPNVPLFWLFLGSMSVRIQNSRSS